MRRLKIPIHEKVIRTNELASILGKSTRWVRYLTEDGVFKPVARGKYVVGEAVRAYVEFSRNKATKKTKGGSHER